MKFYDTTFEGIDEAAKIMVALRGDLYTHATAATEIMRFMTAIEKDDLSEIGTGGFVMRRNIDDEGDVEYILDYHIASFNEWPGADGDEEPFTSTVWCEELIGVIPTGLKRHHDNIPGVDND